MTPAAKFASLRRTDRYDLPTEGDAETTGQEASAPVRNTVRPFPRVAASREVRPVEDAGRRTEAPDLDLAAELEAALMNDLRSMADFWRDEGNVAEDAEVRRDPRRAPAVAPPRAAAPVLAEDDPDLQALDRLLASIRQTDGSAPRIEAPAPEITPEPRTEVAIEPSIIGRPVATEAHTERLGRPGRARDHGVEARATDTPRRPAREPRVARKAAPRIPDPAPKTAPSRGLLARVNKPVLAISALLLLATAGAVLTIQSVTARNETASTADAAQSADTAKSAATVGTAVASEATDLRKTDEAAAPTVTSVAKTEPAAAPEASAPVRLATDTAAPTAAFAPVAEATPLSAEATSPAPTQTAMIADAAPAQPSDAEAAVAAKPVRVIAPAMTAPSVTTPEPAAPVAAELEPVAEPSTLVSEPAPGMATPEPKPSDAIATSEPAAAQPATVVPAATEATAPVRTAAAAGGLAPGSAHIASAVKLRSNPDNGAPVLALLTAGTPLQVVSCKGWCEVVVGDKRGFVFQRFISRS